MSVTNLGGISFGTSLPAVFVLETIRRSVGHGPQVAPAAHDRPSGLFFRAGSSGDMAKDGLREAAIDADILTGDVAG